MAKKYAIQTYTRDKNGTLKATLIDAKTGEPVSSANAKNYDIVTSTDYDAMTLTGQLPGSDNADNKNNKQKDTTPTVTPPKPPEVRFGGGRNNGYTSSGRNNSTGTGSKRDLSNNFGYKHKPGWVGPASAVLRGPLGMAAKAVNFGWDMNNRAAVNKLKDSSLVDKPKEKSKGKSLIDKVKDVIKGPTGEVGTVTAGGKTNKVSLDPTDMGSLSLMEAAHRKEGAMRMANPQNFGMPQQTNAGILHPEIDNSDYTPSKTTREMVADAASATTNLSPSKQSFYDQQKEYAKQAGLTGVAADIAVAQAGLETGYGAHAPGNNYHGIKGGQGYKGAVGLYGTSEQNAAGKSFKTKASFRAYANPVDSYKDWANQIERNWPGVLTAQTFDDAVNALQNQGRLGAYASDKKYKEKLSTYWNEIQSTQPTGISSPNYVSDTLLGEPSADPHQSFSTYSHNYYAKAAIDMAKAQTSFGSGANRPATGNMNSGASNPSNPSQMGGTSMGSGFGKANTNTANRGSSARSGFSGYGNMGSFGAGTSNTHNNTNNNSNGHLSPSSPSNPSQMGGTGMSSGLGNSNTNNRNNDKNKNDNEGATGSYGYGGFGGPR